MTSIIFIRHAPTIPDKDQHSTEWQLGEESQLLCHRLADEIRPYDVRKIYTSVESKAQLTGRFVAEKYGNIPVEAVENLHETERHSRSFYENQDEFRHAVVEAMRKPDDLVFGDETFTDAKNRLGMKVDELAKKHPDETIVIVSHGRILAVYLASIMDESPESIWKKIKMPAYAIFSRENQTITKIQYEIEVI